MTYDSQGRRVMQGHPSTWPQEVEQLRAEKQELALQVLAAEGQANEAYRAQRQAEARVQELEAALQEIVDGAKKIIEEHDRNQLEKENT